MSTEIKNVLIAGGAGNLGAAVVDAFIKSGRFELFILTREDSKSTFPEKTTVLKTDYSQSSLAAIFSAHRIDAVVSNLTLFIPEAAKAQYALIDAAKAGGVKRFFQSEFGPDIANPKVVEHLQPLVNIKAETLSYLEKIKTDEFTWTGIATGPFFDWCLQAGYLLVNLKEKKFIKYDEGTTPFSTTNLPTVGKALVNALTIPEAFAATANKYIFIESHNLTQNQLFAAIEKITGEKWTVENKNSDETNVEARKAMADGNFMAGMDLIMTSTYGKIPYSDFSRKLANSILNLPKEDLEADLRAFLL